MERGFRNLRDCVFHNPLGLSYLPSKTRQLANWYLPRDTGIEFEIELPDLSNNAEDVWSLSPERFLSEDLINEIDELQLRDKSYHYKEQTFRISSGEQGMIQLYKLSHILKKYFSLNPLSGIHYHTSSPFMSTENCCKVLHNNVTGEDFLKELDSWGYTGIFNKRGLSVMSKGTWINLRWDYGTVEYRIGEMTFDYDLLIKRIVHCHSITRKIENYIMTLNDKELSSELPRIEVQNDYLLTDMPIYRISYPPVPNEVPETNF